MRWRLFALLLLGGLHWHCSEPEQVGADLRFKDWEDIYNPCLNQLERLDTRNLYWVPVAGAPGQWVLLYWRTGAFGQGFFDCYGAPWVILPNTSIYSFRYMENNQPSGTEAETAPQPSAQSYTTVIAPDGESQEVDGPLVSFGDMQGGETEELLTTIQITQYGTYINEYEADPVDAVSERNEANNILRDVDVSLEGRLALASFVIRPLEELLPALEANGQPYALYQNGQVEWVSP